ncbi:CAP domain-containing protein [Streptomyces sp. HNM0574]|nr:CAP domain-containing protein [Streptomyces sp. HNM0574]
MRTGLAGASAVVAMGAVAVASGLIPGPGSPGGTQDTGERVRADGPADTEARALPSPSGSSASASADAQRDGRDAEDGADRPGGRGETAKPSSSGGSASAEASPSPSATDPSQRADEGERGGGSASGGGAPASPAGDGGTSGPAKGVEAEVLRLVNEERAEAGCKAVTADSGLARLAREFSTDMAERDFFSHTTPDGKSPWDRAEALGIPRLGGENIARGQADAEAVMESWMNSPGHRENILNCDYRTLGVGVHLAEGGPWWTQDFGF